MARGGLACGPLREVSEGGVPPLAKGRNVVGDRGGLRGRKVPQVGEAGTRPGARSLGAAAKGLGLVLVLESRRPALSFAIFD